MRNRKRKSWFILIASVCFVFLAASCGGGNNTGKVGLTNAVMPPSNNDIDDTNNHQNIWSGLTIVTDDLENAPPEAWSPGDAQNNDDDQDDWDDWNESGKEDAFSNIMHTTWAKINNVSHSQPNANHGTRITATILPIGDEDEDAEVERTATIIYRINNGTLHQTSMTLEDENVFSGEIPAQTAGSVVDYYIRIEDNFGNVTSGAFPSDREVIYMVSGVADFDNSPDIIQDDLDLFKLFAGYDNEYIYIRYSVIGEISGGTIDPPYVHMYGAKFTNPDIEQSEGLMVGKLWFNMPIMTEPDGQGLLSEMLGQSGYPDGVDQEDFDEAMQSGQIFFDIQKLMSGNLVEGMMYDAEPQGTAAGGVFTGRVRRDAFGDMPSGYIRIVTLTMANASIGSFMPIPLNCSHFLTLKTEYYGYVVP